MIQDKYKEFTADLDYIISSQRKQNAVENENYTDLSLLQQLTRDTRARAPRTKAAEAPRPAASDMVAPDTRSLTDLLDSVLTEEASPRAEEPPQTGLTSSPGEVPDFAIEEKQEQTTTSPDLPLDAPHAAGNERHADTVAFLQEEGDDYSEADGTESSLPPHEPEQLPDRKAGEPQNGGIRETLLAMLQSHALIGLDVGYSAVKYVVLRPAGNGYQLKDYGCEPYPGNLEDVDEADKLDARLRFAGEVLHSKIRKTDWITSSVSGLEVIYRLLQVPKMPRKELKDAIPWAVRKDLPFDIESATVDFEIVGTHKTGRVENLQAATVAVPTKFVEKHISLYDSLRIIPERVTTIPTALYNVVMAQKKYAEASMLVVEIGAVSTHLVFIDSGLLRFHREITTAWNDFVDVIVNSIFGADHHLSLSPADGREILLHYGIPDEATADPTENGIPLGEIGINIRPVLERLENEIRRSVDYYKEKFKIQKLDRVLLSGGGGRIRNIRAMVSRAADAPAELLDPLAAIGVRNWQQHEKIAEMAPRFSVALGLAMNQRLQINLLPAELRGASRLRKTRKLLRYAFVAIFLVLVLASSYTSLQLRQFTADMRRLQAEYKKLEPVREEFLALTRQREQLQLKYQTYTSKILLNKTAAGHLKAVSNLVPRYVALTSMTIEPAKSDQESDENAAQERGEQIVLRGIAFPDRALEGANLAAFLLKLENSGYFREVEIVGQDSRADGTITFVVKCLY